MRYQKVHHPEADKDEFFFINALPVMWDWMPSEDSEHSASFMSVSEVTAC